MFFYGRGHKLGDELSGRLDPDAYRISRSLITLSNYAITRLIGNDYFTSARAKSILPRFFSQPNLVHLHDLHGYIWNPLEIIKLFPPEKRVVWTIHDLWLITAGCAYPFDCLKYMKIPACLNCGKNLSYPKHAFSIPPGYIGRKWRVLKRVWHNITFVTPSVWAQKTLAGSALFRTLGQRPVHVIHNAIDDQFFYKRDKSSLKRNFLHRSGYTGEKKIVLFVAEILADQRKGITYINQLMMDWQDRKDILFVGVGRRNPGLKHINLFQAGYIENKKELAEIYSLADVLVLPTLNDNYPTTALEAVSCHTPVVAFDTGGVCEIVKDKKNGFLVHRGDLSAVKQAVQKCFAYPDFDFSEEHILDLDRYVHAYEELYKDILPDSC